MTKAYGWEPNSTWTTNPVFMREGESYYYYHNDHLGTPQKLTAQNGQVVWSAKYIAFGEAEIDLGSTIVNNLRFPGQYQDEETQLHYNYHRYYDARSGRYITLDPIEFEKGMNSLYIYVKSNPINWIDSTGLYCGSGSTDKSVPDYPGVMGRYNFVPACIWHDKCYETCGMKKSDCDKGFRARMIDECKKYPKKRADVTDYNNLMDLRGECETLASTYYNAVKYRGGQPYEKAQLKNGCCKYITPITPGESGVSSDTYPKSPYLFKYY